MKIKKDIRDLDKFIDGIEKEVVDYFDGHAREAVKIQQQKANYLNHTWNLRSSIGCRHLCRKREGALHRGSECDLLGRT